LRQNPVCREIHKVEENPNSRTSYLDQKPISKEQDKIPDMQARPYTETEGYSLRKNIRGEKLDAFASLA